LASRKYIGGKKVFRPRKIVLGKTNSDGHEIAQNQSQQKRKRKGRDILNVFQTRGTEKRRGSGGKIEKLGCKDGDTTKRIGGCKKFNIDLAESFSRGPGTPFNLHHEKAE